MIGMDKKEIADHVNKHHSKDFKKLVKTLNSHAKKVKDLLITLDKEDEVTKIDKDIYKADIDFSG
jgi:hypothetical protein